MELEPTLVVLLRLDLDNIISKGILQWMIMIEEMETTLKKGQPFQLEVDDEEDGDQVTILITR